MAISTVRWRSHAPAASILRLELGLLVAELLVVGVGIGPGGQDLVVAGQQAGDFADPFHHVAVHVLDSSSSGSWAKKPT